MNESHKVYLIEHKLLKFAFKLLKKKNIFLGDLWTEQKLRLKSIFKNTDLDTLFITVNLVKYKINYTIKTKNM